jgi:hypothetical protein
MITERIPHELLKEKMTRIVDFLRTSQRPDGEFPTLRFFHHEVGNYVQHTEYENWYYFGKCPFAAATIVHHLKDIQLPSVDETIRKACEFLKRGNENGVYRYVASYDKKIHFATDIDDSALSISALKESGYTTKENPEMIYANANRDGDLYTWLIPRWSHTGNLRNLLWLCKDFSRYYQASRKFGLEFKPIWREYKEKSEPAIAANVLLYLGQNNRTQRWLERLIDRIQRNDTPVQYYQNLLVVYFHVARLYHRGILDVDILKEKIFEYISEKQDLDGRVINGLWTAASVLIYFYFHNSQSEVVKKAVQYLFLDKMHETGWVPLPYCNDTNDIFSDGSAELTATLYLEALYRYGNQIDRP